MRLERGNFKVSNTIWFDTFFYQTYLSYIRMIKGVKYRNCISLVFATSSFLPKSFEFKKVCCLSPLV